MKMVKMLVIGCCQLLSVNILASESVTPLDNVRSFEQVSREWCESAMLANSTQGFLERILISWSSSDSFNRCVASRLHTLVEQNRDSKYQNREVATDEAFRVMFSSFNSDSTSVGKLIGQGADLYTQVKNEDPNEVSSKDLPSGAGYKNIGALAD